MTTLIKITIISSIIVATALFSTLAYLTQTDFFIVPKRTSGDQWTTSYDCPENFVIYENNCVPVNSENRSTFDAVLYFKSVDGTITELCKRDFQVAPEAETCEHIPAYGISENNEITILWDYEDWNNSQNFEYPVPGSAIISDLYPIKKQFEAGLNFEDLRCNEGFVIITKYDGSPACVKPETRVKLMELRWTEPLGDIVFERTVPADPTIVDVLIPRGSANIESENYLIPKTITVVLGVNNTVRWINEDDTASTLVSDYQPRWSTGMILPGQSAFVIFNETGIYDYHGSPHPWKTGKVIVLEE